ncbi:MAG: hypothetical protein ACYDAY_11350 [Candidatus Dormibacteria bacterium]
MFVALAVPFGALALCGVIGGVASMGNSKGTVAVVTPAATPTPKASPTPTPPPAVTPTPAVDPHALTEANVHGSIESNKNEMLITDWTNEKITIGPDNSVLVTVEPQNVLDENHMLMIGAEDTFIVARAVLGWYPAAASVQVQALTTFTDTYGKSTSEVAVSLTVTPATAAKFGWDGLADRVKSSAAIMYCDADAYTIHPAIWKNLSSSQRDCLTSSSSDG